MTLLPVNPGVMTQMVPPIVVGLSDDERQAISQLDAVYLWQQMEMRVHERYYLGAQRVKNLRIAVPQELEFLETIVGWPAFAVDPYVERLAIDGFRLHGATDVDPLLTDLWVANGMDAQLPLATTDALSMGRGFFMVGALDAFGIPKVTVESPLNFSIKWDNTGTSPLSAWQTYWQDGRYHGTLMLPDRTLTLSTDDVGNWQVIERNQHNLGFVPLVRMPHAPRTNERSGRSAITPAIRSVTDSAMRDLLGLEVAREFYSIPRVVMLGASEADFVNTDGTTKSAWESLITKFNAFQRDDEGNVPEFKQLTAYDPSVFTKLFEMRASQMASLVAAPPQDLGLYTSGNPTSADAVDAMETRRNRKAKVLQAQFGQALVEVMKMQLRVMNKGALPSKYENFTAEWLPTEDVNPVAASQAIAQQVTSGIVPARSDVVLKRLGYSARERAQIEQDFTAANDASAADRIIAAVQNSGQNNAQPGVNGGAGDSSAPQQQQQDDGSGGSSYGVPGGGD